MAQMMDFGGVDAVYVTARLEYFVAFVLEENEHTGHSEIVPYKLDGRLRDGGLSYEVHQKLRLWFIEKPDGSWVLQVSKRTFNLKQTLVARKDLESSGS